MQETIINAIVEGIKQSVLNFLKWIGLGIINGSYWICLTACLIALILYIAGQRKAGKYVSISFIIYVVLQAIKGVLI
ncbi:MAG: hypothetical protein E6344_19825 [Clostridium sp.]|jgi:hypothetical protein|uniref:hypothetical protein n=1 Tax=Clostridium tertium TaxID=1559 RepID=UPI0029112331|nr:hypothetical protein [Clostridium sp.]